jgi:hypothetical protein
MKSLERFLGCTTCLNPVRVLAMMLGFAMCPSFAAVNCSAASTTADSDGDGFPDALECGPPISIGGISYTLDPNVKNLFVVYVPAASGYLRPDQPTSIANPFAPFNAYNLQFDGFTAIGLRVHMLTATQLPPFDDRIIPGTTQKAVVVFEDLDASDIVLGYCQYGTPASSGICTVYTQRIMNYLTETCAGRTVSFPSGAAVPGTNPLAEVFKAYTVQTILHEIGHTLGGLTGRYDNKYGGYHYAPNTTVMEEYVLGSVTDATKCKFYVHSAWNVKSDSGAIRLK